MAKNKLDRLLSQIPYREMQELKKWASSPLHNPRKEARDLFSILYSARFQKLPPPSETELHRVIWPEKNYSPLDLRHLRSQVYKVVEDFLIDRQCKKDPHLRQSLLLEALQSLEMEKEIASALQKGQKKLAAEPNKDQASYYQAFKLHRTAYSSSRNRNQFNTEALEGTIRQLDNFYILQALTWATSALNHQRIFRFDYHSPLLEKVLDLAAQLSWEEEPAIAVYYKLYLSLNHSEQTQHFRDFRDLLYQSEGVFGQEELKSLYLLGINYCIRRLNQGKSEYFEEVFLLYQKGLSSEALLDRGKLSPFTYKNIVAAALRLQEFQWAENFTKEYAGRLDSPEQDSYQAFVLARLAHAKGELKKVVSLLKKVETADLFTRLDAKVLQIKTYHELGETSFVEYLLDSFKQFLRRKEILTYHRQLYSSFIRFAQKMNRLPEGDKSRSQKILDKLEAHGPLPEKHWLKGQIQQKAGDPGA